MKRKVRKTNETFSKHSATQKSSQVVDSVDFSISDEEEFPLQIDLPRQVSIKVSATDKNPLHRKGHQNDQKQSRGGLRSIESKVLI